MTFDPNTTVGLFPWEDSTFGATRSYHLNSASVASSNPFTQMMAPAMDARSEMSVEAKVDKDDNTEQRSRMTDEEKKPRLRSEVTPSEQKAKMKKLRTSQIMLVVSLLDSELPPLSQVCLTSSHHNKLK